MTLKSCLKSMRLRTLPLSLSGVIMGMFAAGSFIQIRVPVAAFLILTTCLLQILSNLSNELGDILNGTDTEAREGVHYSIQDGEMTIPQMKKLITAVALLCCLSGLLMTWLAFGTVFDIEPLLLLLLGAAAIVAAVRYTLGHNPYGYRGLGDIFVFIFFGLVSTVGGCYVSLRGCVCPVNMPLWMQLTPSFLPACAVGCFSVGVLNVNNIRDMKTDAATRKTVALKLGLRRARIYQTVLIALGWLLLTSGFIIRANASGFRRASCLFLLTLPLFGMHLKGVWTREGRSLDPMLPLLVMSTFILTVLYGIGVF